MRNGEGISLRKVPVLELADLREEVVRAVADGAHLSAFFGVPQGEQVRLYAVLSEERVGALSVFAADVAQSYPSFTPDCAQAHYFERELAEQWAVRPEGHPWLEAIRSHAPYRGAALWPQEGPAVRTFYRVEGPSVHEVAVGPVHAGIIEPGHFRFQCHGETVMHLEIALGFQHRGIERALIGGPHPRTIHQMETLAGDTTIGHSWAYAQALEGLAGVKAPARAQALRGVLLELERLANHTGDLGALAGDVGYLPTSSFNGRIRGDFLNMTALLCGNRFGRNQVRPGGVALDCGPERATQLLERLKPVERDAIGACSLLWETPSVMARFEGTGVVPRAMARAIGLVGPAARASGMERDVRQDFPTGIYAFEQIPVAVCDTGDVFGRAFVRFTELERSARFVREVLPRLPEGPTRVALPPLRPEHLVVSLVEGWRGEIAHVAITDADGKLAAYKVVDPSFHNWYGLAMALREQAISDFPLCNKSFNLSYCGHDL